MRVGGRDFAPKVPVTPGPPRPPRRGGGPGHHPSQCRRCTWKPVPLPLQPRQRKAATASEVGKGNRSVFPITVLLPPARTGRDLSLPSPPLPSPACPVKQRLPLPRGSADIDPGLMMRRRTTQRQSAKSRCREGREAFSPRGPPNWTGLSGEIMKECVACPPTRGTPCP